MSSVMTDKQEIHRNTVTSEDSTDKNRNPRRGLRRAVVVLGCVALVLAGVWLVRKPIAQWGLSSVCDAHGLSCSADFPTVSLGAVELAQLKVAGGGMDVVRAERVRIGLGWNGPFSPALSSISASKPVIRGKLADNKVNLGGLESLASGGGSGGGAIPAIEIIDGRAYFETPAGELSASFEASGTLPENGALSIVLDPAELSSPRGAIAWETGRVIVTAQNGAIDGELALQLSSALVDDLSGRDIDVKAEAKMDGVGEGPLALVWTTAIGQARFPAGELLNVKSNGDAVFAQMPEVSLSGAAEALMSMVFAVSGDAAAYGAYGAEQFTLTGELAQDGDQNLSGPVSISLNSVKAAQGRIDAATATGRIFRDPDGLLNARGNVKLKGASVTPEMRETALAVVALPGALSAHGAAMRSVLSRGLADFDLETELSAQLSKGELTLESDQASVLEAVSDLKITTEPPVGAPWLRVAGSDVQMAGTFLLVGGGGPKMTAKIDDLSRTEQGFNAVGQTLNISPWLASGRTVSGVLNDFSIQIGGGDLSIESQARLTLAGKFSGATLAPTKLSGAIAATQTDGEWHVQTKGGNCLSFASEGISFGALGLDAITSDLCAPGGQFIRKGARTPGGEINLATMRVPFTTQSGGGTLEMTDTMIDWQASEGLAMTVRGETFSLPLKLGERLLTVDSDAPVIGVQIGNGPLKVTAEMAKTNFGGSLIPANVSADRFAFNGMSGPSGISGKLDADAIVFSDTREDALYEPLIMDVSAALTDGTMRFDAPLRLKRGGISVADIAVELDVVKVTGTIDVQSRPLSFKAAGLQPKMLSQRLTGVFTNAVGMVNVLANLRIDGGTLSGTGAVTADEFGFQTIALGRVEGVNGTVNFDDLIGLSTPPGQAVFIKSINPGIALQDGELVFHLESGGRLGIEVLKIPFAQGELSMVPSVWTFGAEEQNLRFEAHDIALESLVETLKIPDLEATGTVSGSFPVEIEGASVKIINAKLLADATGGRLAYVGAAAEGAGQANENVEMAFDALKDFRFSVLELGLDGDVSDRMTVTLKLFGRNPKVVGGGEFDFNISIDSQLQELINNGQFLARQTTISKIVENQQKAKEKAAAQDE